MSGGEEETGFGRSLLPGNSRRFERALAAGLAMPQELWPAAGKVGDIDIDIPDASVPFFVWELGLEPLLPYLADMRQAIREGARWQTIRGTPQAVAMALDWLKVEGGVEEMPLAFNWQGFQLSLAELPTDAGQLASLIALARLSSPQSMVLRRIHSGYDRRTARVNLSRVNGPSRVNDWSGVFSGVFLPGNETGDAVRLSFGDCTEIASDPPPAPVCASESEITLTARHSRGFHVNRSMINGAARVQLRHEVDTSCDMERVFTHVQAGWVRWPLTPLPKAGGWDDGSLHVAGVKRLVVFSDESCKEARWPIDVHPRAGGWRDVPRAGAVIDIV